MLFGMSNEVRYDSRVLGQIKQSAMHIYATVSVGVKLPVAMALWEEGNEILIPSVEWDQGRRHRVPWT